MSKQPTLIDPVPNEALEPTTADLGSVIERLAKDKDVDIDKFERLISLYKDLRALTALTAYQAAMSEAQGEMRPIAADASNPQTSSRYASYKALDEALRPIYTRHGFSLSFNSEPATRPEDVRVVCDVTHLGGHTKPYHIDIPADGKGAKGGDVMTKTHATGSAVSYGMRYLLRMIFGIAINDDDGNAAAGRRPYDEPAPEGYDAWLAALETARSPKDFSDAWNPSKSEFRNHLAATNPDRLKAIKRAAGLKV